MNVAETILILVLLLITAAVIVWVGLYVYAAWCKRRYAEQAAGISRRLDVAAGELVRAEQIASRYGPDAPPPYGPLVKDLAQRVMRARESYDICSDQLSQLQDTAPRPSPALADRLLATYVTQPRVWRWHVRAARVLSLQVTTLEKQLAGLQQSTAQMQNLPLGVAGRARGVLGAIDRVTRACQALQQAGVRGEGLDALIATVQTHSRSLEHLPDYFTQGSDEVVRARATQEATQEAWQRLSNVEKSVYDALRRAQDWQTVHAEAKNMVGGMQMEVGAVERLLRELPAPIDAGSLAAQFATLQRGTEAIESAWRAPDVHGLTDLSNAATKQVLALRELSDSLHAVQRTFQGFEQAVASNAAVLERLRTVVDDLQQSPRCPLHWVDSAGVLAQLLATHDAIGDTSLSRNGTRLEADLNRALDLGLQAGTLEAHVNDVRDHHKQLVALLANPEVEARAEWFHEAAALHVAASPYAPENWPADDGITHLKADAAALLHREQELVPLFGNQPVSETDLRSWIDRVNHYLGDRRTLQTRLNSIEGTLRSIERVEAAAQSNLSHALETLGKLNQNLPNMLTAAPVVSAWNTLLEQWRAGGQLAESLEQRMTGRVADKAASVGDWLRQCGDSVNELAQHVEAEAGTTRQQLHAQVETLVSIASFDAEPGMTKAQQLLNEPSARPMSGKSAGRAGGRNAAGKSSPRDVAGDIANLVAQTNAALERHSHLSETLDDLTDHVVTQVEPRMARLDEVHAAAWDKLQEVRALLRQIPFMKPLPVVCDEAEQLEETFKQAETSLENLTTTGRTVKLVTGQLDSLAQQFGHVASQGARVQADVERDLVRLRGLWDQTSQWMRQLKRYREWQSQDAALGQAIGARLDEIEQHFADIQRRYKGRPLPIENACTELDVLLHATRRDVEIMRANGVEVLAAYTIQSV